MYVIYPVIYLKTNFTYQHTNLGHRHFNKSIINQTIIGILFIKTIKISNKNEPRTELSDP